MGGRVRRFIKPWVPLSYKVLRSPEQYKAHKFLYKTKKETQIPAMQKNPGENFTTVEVDPVTGEYYVVLPEWVVSEFGWYEGTEVNMEVDGGSIVITEVSDWLPL